MSHYYSWIFRIFPWNAPLKTWRSSATAARWRAPVPPPWWRQRSPRGRAARCQRLSWLHVVQTHSLYEYLYVIYMDSLYYIDYRFFLGGSLSISSVFCSNQQLDFDLEVMSLLSLSRPLFNKRLSLDHRHIAILNKEKGRNERDKGQIEWTGNTWNSELNWTSSYIIQN